MSGSSDPRRGLQAVAAAYALAVVMLLQNGLAVAGSQYTLDDFQRIEKIDAHVHLNGGLDDQFMAQAVRDGFRVLTINVDYPDFPPIDEQQREAIALRKRYPGRVAFAATISVADFQSPDWASAQLHHIDEALEQGAVGVKIWKNIGLQLRDPDGKYVMIDDPRFAPIFNRLERDRIVLLGHQAEPLNCWLPFERMTVRSDRDYFREHPQYYMYQHPEVPSHEAQLTARDHMLAIHPALRFDSVHLASLEWDVDAIARFLDRFPQASVDVAARMSHLESQAVHHRGKVRRFLIRYQDRILYGTDIEAGASDSSTTLAADTHAAWLQDWSFLTTGAELHSPEFGAPFRGLALPKAVVDKIYRINARKMYPGGWQDQGGV